MTDFEEQRGELARLRQELEQNRELSLLSREAVRQSERALAELARRGGRRDQDEQARLQARLEQASAWAAQSAEDAAGLRAAEAEVLKAFDLLSDPRQQIGIFSNRHPILLFPLRIETRFKTNPNGAPQLWLRVYPDPCLIDTFEASLTEQEVANAQAFWARMWSAAEDEALERAAWRELVAAYGSGRAGWIIRQYMPRNPSEKPPATDGANVRLIITANTPLSTAVPAYWEAVWKAKDDSAAQQAAFVTLEGALGAAGAREVLERYRPFNLNDPPPAPLTREQAVVKATVLQVTAAGEMETRRTSWSSAARIDLLPDRFFVIAYPRAGDPVTALGRVIRTPLLASPDPNAPPEQQLKPVDDQVQIPEDVAWMFDFDKAVAAGMALQIDITAVQAREGFERVVVLGVRLGDTAGEGREHLARLLEHHLYSRTGMEIVPQGAPTNNTEKGGAAYSFRDDPEASFATFVHDVPQYEHESDPLLRRDGQWLADVLGLPYDLARRIPHASGTDQSEARAMQIALWPGTLGYMMKSLLTPVFSPEDVEWTRGFFTRYVSGRGPLPALRVGRQPYGIVLTTAFDRIAWGDPRDSRDARLYEILKRADADWRQHVSGISFVGRRNSDPHQILLDVLGLHPSSVEYHPLQAESVEHKYYEVSFFGTTIGTALLGLFPWAGPLGLLRSFGYGGAEVPDLLNKVYKARQTPLDGPVVDDRPLSETDPIRAYAGNLNYIQWLAAAARSGIFAIQREQGFDGGRKPAALLYLFLRHALQLAFRDTGLKLQVQEGVLQNLAAAQREPTFVHIVGEQKTSESSYAVLFDTDPRITKSDGVRVGDHIASNIGVIDPDLREQMEALDRLATVPTARLERLFAEHVDACGYRLDAWKTALYALQLESLRATITKRESPGVFLGAYGWLEPLRPRRTALRPAVVPEEIAGLVNQRDAGTPLMSDPGNAGLIHAPSLNHATTAAVLRNGYLANGGQLAVNLTSRRVRLAVGILEGMRNGQSLGALLGYQFERHVHDHGPLQVRDVIYALRREFPLVANQINNTNTESGEARESIAAMNVVDGRKLIERVESVSPPNVVYPFGTTTLPGRPAAQEQALTNALAHIRNINDAVADLVLAEGVHQAVLGNYERSAGTLDAFAKGNYPPEPEVIRTPRTGVALTFRTAIHFSPAPPADPLPGIALTPLATAEPAVNAWLKDRLPPPLSVGCDVVFVDRDTGAEGRRFVSQTDLGLHPIDLLYRVQASTEQSLGDLDDEIVRFIETNEKPRHDRPIRIAHTERVPNRVTWFEVQALLQSLRAVVVASRPLRPADLMRANDAAADQQGSLSLPRQRVSAPRTQWDPTLLAALDDVTAQLNDPNVTIDEALTRFAAAVSSWAAYRLPQSGTGFLYEWRAREYTALAAKIGERVKDWNERLARYDAHIAGYDLEAGALTEEERMARLGSAEIIISTEFTDPVPANANDYRNNVLPARRNAFVTKRDALQQLVTVARPAYAQFLQNAKDALPLTAFDPNPISFDDEEAEVARFRAELKTSVAAIRDDVTKRIVRVDALLTRHDAAAAGDEKVRLLQEAAKIVFGDDFQFVPHMTLPANAAGELANAWQHSRSGDLTSYLTATVKREFPVDDWLHGVARVRDKMHHWENVVLLGDAFRTAVTELTPLQLPFFPNDPWLALEFPEAHEITSDRLLYTAHFAEDLDTAQPVCGVFVDEWTEVIPGVRETTGIAFHYDRPNSEPPQAWLLALSPSRRGEWSWDDLLATVNDTLDAAKRRAIEPVHLDTTPYSTFLPATVSAYTFPEISISNNLLRNRNIYTR